MPSPQSPTSARSPAHSESSLRSDVDPLNATNFCTDHLFGLFVAQALDDPSRNVPYLLQGASACPTAKYYLSDKTQMAELRTKYQAHVAAMLKLAGAADADAKKKAARIYALRETHGPGARDRVESEDVHGVISWKREELTRALASTGRPSSKPARCRKRRASSSGTRRPPPADGARRQRAARHLEGLAHVSHDRARRRGCPRPSSRSASGFYGKALSGTPQQQERWKRGVDFTNDAREAVGRLYVQRYFSPEEGAGDVCTTC